MYDFVLVYALISLCATSLAQDSITINIGGPRKATATISESGDEYEIKVSLIPVRCFDSGMNRRLSQDKARSCATATLIRHVGGDKQQSATISKVEIIQAEIVDSRFVLVMRVPRKSIRLVEAQGETPTVKPEDRNARRSHLKSTDDYQERLEVKPQFSDVVIEKHFKPYLLGNPLLMEVTGAKVIRQKNGQTILLSVSSTTLKDDSANERLRAEKVCRTKALAGIIAEKKGIQVFHVETLNEKTEVVVDEKGEHGTSVSELLQVTQTKVEGISKDMPVIGRWRSKDGMVFYLAIGRCVDENGESVEIEEDE
jgi:hypothetical protein